MSPGLERWLPLVPAAVAVLYFVIGMIAFSVRSAIWGVSHDRDIEASGRSILIGNYLRNYFSWVIRPLWLLVLASGISPNAVTVLATMVGIGSGVAVASGGSRWADGCSSCRGPSTRSTASWRACATG